MALGDVQCHDHLIVRAAPEAPTSFTGECDRHQSGAEDGKSLRKLGHRANWQDGAVLSIVKGGDVRGFVVFYVLIAEDDVAILPCDYYTPTCRKDMIWCR